MQGEIKLVLWVVHVLRGTRSLRVQNRLFRYVEFFMRGINFCFKEKGQGEVAKKFYWKEIKQLITVRVLWGVLRSESPTSAPALRVPLKK